MKDKNWLRTLLAELIGTFFLILMGCASIIVDDIHGGIIGHMGVSMTFGLIVMILIYSIGNISGAHMNPAVSWGFFLAGRIKAKTLFVYWPSQFAGALLAGGILKLAFPRHMTLGSTLASSGIVSALITEIILSALLMFVILNVSTGHREKGIMAGVAVGGAIALSALVGGPLSGASMNPARSLAPMLFSRNLDNLWIYFLGPILGVSIAFPSCQLIQGEQCCTVNEIS